MIVSVLPLRRLPRRFGTFDYIWTGSSTNNVRVQVGQLVVIPFQNKIIFGIVMGAKDGEPDTMLKEIIDIVYSEPLFLPRHLALIETMSVWYGISLSAAALLFAPPLQKKKLRSIDLPSLTLTRIPTVTTHPLPRYHYYRSDNEHRQCLEKSLFGATLIIVPEVSLIHEIFLLLPLALQQKTLLWHSDLSIKEQFEGWWQVRRGEVNVVIGTRSALFLPFPTLDTVIIDYEQDENHKHADQAPRYHVKDVAPLLAPNLHLMSFSPSCEVYHDLYGGRMDSCANKEHPQKNERWFVPQDPKIIPTIVDMRDERRAKNFSLFSEVTIDAVSSGVGDVFLFLNRLGFATSVGCNDCGYTARCSSCELPLLFSDERKTLECRYCRNIIPMILSCPKCQAPIVHLRGAGTELVEREIRRRLGDGSSYTIERIDSTRDPYDLPPRHDGRRIVIGTEMALPKIEWGKTTAIVFVDMDRQLAIPEYGATERVWHQIAFALHKRRRDSKFFIQTFHPEHIVLRSCVDPDRFYRTELSGRKTFGYPPYTYLVRYLCGKSGPDEAKREANQLHTALSSLLTRSGKKIILMDPMEAQPKFHRGQYWYILVAKFDRATRQDDLVWLNSYIPDSWKIDPHPTSLLTP